MNQEQEKLVRKALNSMTTMNQKTRYLLKEALGDETSLKYIDGHVVNEDGICVDPKCELWAPHVYRDQIDQEVSMDWLETVAEKTDCPAPQESIEANRPAYVDECPSCGNSDTWSHYCKECGMPLGG